MWFSREIVFLSHSIPLNSSLIRQNCSKMVRSPFCSPIFNYPLMPKYYKRKYPFFAVSNLSISYARSYSLYLSTHTRSHSVWCLTTDGRNKRLSRSDVLSSTISSVLKGQIAAKGEFEAAYVRGFNDATKYKSGSAAKRRLDEDYGDRDDRFREGYSKGLRYVLINPSHWSFRRRITVLIVIRVGYLLATFTPYVPYFQSPAFLARMVSKVIPFFAVTLECTECRRQCTTWHSVEIHPDSPRVSWRDIRWVDQLKKRYPKYCISIWLTISFWGHFLTEPKICYYFSTEIPESSETEWHLRSSPALKQSIRVSLFVEH